jgi:Lipocalin-like domain
MEEIMNRRVTLTMTTIALLSLGIAFPAGDVLAQGKSLKEQIVGSWTYASADTVRPDGSKEPTFGPNPAGLVIFGSDGRYVSLVVRADVPKFASNSRIAGTPEENKAAVHGGIATFGRYSIDEANKTLILQIERSSFPNWNGTEQKRPITITGDELKYTVLTPSAGAGRAEVVLKRAK